MKSREKRGSARGDGKAERLEKLSLSFSGSLGSRAGKIYHIIPIEFAEPRLRVVPHFSSGIAERAKRERA